MKRVCMSCNNSHDKSKSVEKVFDIYQEIGSFSVVANVYEYMCYGHIYKYTCIAISIILIIQPHNYTFIHCNHTTAANLLQRWLSLWNKKRFFCYVIALLSAYSYDCV